jgi:hypothetical protein
MILSCVHPTVAKPEERRVGSKLQEYPQGLLMDTSLAKLLVLVKKDCELWFISIFLHFSVNQNHFHFTGFDCSWVISFSFVRVF